MNDKFQSLTEKGRWLLATLTLIFTLGIGQMWAAETILATFRINLSSAPTDKYASYADDDATYTCNKVGSNSSSNYALVGSQYYMKLTANDAYVKIKLKSGSIQAGDKVYVYHNHTSNKNGVGFAMTSGGTNGATGNATANTELKLSYTLTASDIASDGSISVYRQGSNLYVGKIEVARSSGGGCAADPAAPTKLEAGSITENGVTFSITDAADAGKYDFYYSTSSTAPASTATATATSTAKTKEITSLTASTQYYAWVRSVCDDTHKSAWVALTGGSFITAAPDPCTKHFWANDADLTTLGLTKSDIFSGVPASSGNSASGSITIDGTKYDITKRSSNTTPNITFTIPANKSGKLYVMVQGSSDRSVQLKKGDNVIQSIVWENSVASHDFNVVGAGTYTLTSTNNVGWCFIVLKVCDATYRTITLDLDGGTGATSVQAIDGYPATKPADPTKTNCDFVKWVVKSTSAAYDWDANVTGDLELKAIWAPWPTLTLAAGEGATGTPVATQYKAGAEITVPEKPSTFSNGVNVFDGWTYSQEVSVNEGKFNMPSTDLTLTAKWTAPTDFNVRFFQGYGEPDTQIGTTQSVTVNSYATAPTTDPTREGYRFLGWSYDATATHIVNVAEYPITAATDFTAMWQQVWTVSFDGAEVTVDNGKKVASPDSPSQAGQVFQGWYNGESKYDFSANVTADLVLTSKWEDSNPNHFYYNYKDDFHYDGVVYKTPEGKVDNKDGESNKAITTPYTLFSGAEGITSIVATNGIYDSKNNWVNAYLKINTSSDSYLTITIKAGYTAVLKMKMGSWDVSSKAADITLKDADDHTYTYTGTQSGKASTENNYVELTYSNLPAGTYTMTTSSKTLYISHIDLEATALPQYSVTYLPNGGSGPEQVVDANTYYAGEEVTLIDNPFTPASGYIWNAWSVTYVDGDSQVQNVEVNNGKFTMPAFPVTVTALWEDNSSVAKIGDTKYTNLDDAVTYALAHPGSEIVLLQDITRPDRITLNVDVTLNLNGHKLAKTDGGWLIFLEGGTFTVNGTTDDSEIHGGIAIGKATNVNANLVLNGGYYHRSGAVLHTNGTCLNSNVTINGATIESESDNAIQFNGYGIYNVDGATITGATGIYVKSGVLNVTNSTVTGTMAPADYSYYGNGAHATGDGVVVDACNYPGGAPTINIISGDFSGTKSAVGSYNYQGTSEPAIGGIIGGTFSSRVPNELCAPGLVPSAADPVTGKYSVEPKDGVEIIGVVTTGGTNKTVSGLYQGDATVNLDGDQKIGSGKYIYVTLKEGYTFEENDVLIVDLKAKSDLSGGTKALEITTGVGNIDGAVWKSIAYEDYDGSDTISLKGIAAGQTSIGLKRSANQNAWVNGIKVLRPLKPILTAITINDVAADIDETNKTVAITLPEATTDLAALTVVPTIVWNAAATENSIVVNNGAAWQEGANTYKLTDKDGDVTTYTITITLQGEAPAPVIETQPADVAYCAGSEPTLTVVATGNELHYAWFKEAGETDEAVGSDQATYTVASAGTYYVIVTNHVDTKLDKSVTSANAVVTLNVAAAITKQPANKRDVVANTEVTLSVEATNATGYQWYICDDAEKHNADAISGAEAANYVFNCTANAFYYCVVGNACGADIESNVVSVKLEPEGCNVLDGDLPTDEPYIYDNGEWTLYAVTNAGKHDGTSRFTDEAKDFNGNTVKAIRYSRFGMTFAEDVESLTIYATSSSNERSISSIQVTTDDISTGTPTYADVTFTASAEALGKKDSSSPYRYVLEANDMLLEAGKKYKFAFSGTIDAFKICYSEALAMPVLPTLSDQELCASAAYETFDATITNAAACEGTVSYKWFSTADTENPVAETAEFTPTAEGTYYVVVTHAKAGHISRVAQSDELSVAHFDALSLVSYSEDVFQHMGTETTLSVVATGKSVAYVWYTCSNAAGDDAVAITPAQTASSLTIASILEGVHYYKVVISHDCDETTLSHVFKVEGWDQLEQVDVTETTTWDMTNVSANAINLKDDYNPSKQNVRLLLANIEGVNNNASFNSQALMFEGQHIGRTGAGIKHLAGRYVQFNVTVPGAVFVTFESNGDNARTISINGKKCSRTTAGTDADDYITYALAVEPGSVEIIGYEGTSANQYVRISKIEFKAEASHTRINVNPSFLGTLCWTNNAILGGATLYEFQGKNENNYLVFDEVAENRLEAGKPYIFMPENGSTEIKLYNTDSDPALTEDQEPVNHMYGTITGKTLVPGQDDNMYYFSSNHIWAVKDFTGVEKITIPAYYCYIDYPAVLADEPAPAAAPGRRRVTMGVQGEQVVTGMENLNASEQPVKLLINGQIFILRGEKLFDATGRLVK